jgi:uncharacterized membrane protein YhaH (DUF805 family)
MGVLRRFRPTWYASAMLINAFKLVVAERYAEFSGRAGRAEYWWFFLANVLISVGFNILGRASGLFVFLGFLVSIALLVPSLAVAVRRLHDIGRSGLWLLLVLLPIVGLIIVIVFLATDGDKGPNEFGVTAPGP